MTTKKISIIIVILLLTIQVVAQIPTGPTPTYDPKTKTYTYDGKKYVPVAGTTIYRHQTGGGTYQDYDPVNNDIYIVNNGVLTEINDLTNQVAIPADYAAIVQYNTYLTESGPKTEKEKAAEAKAAEEKSAPPKPKPENTYSVPWKKGEDKDHQTYVGGQFEVGTDIVYQNSAGNQVAKIDKDGLYYTWDGKEWDEVTSTNYEDAIDDSIEKDLIADGMDESAADKAADKKAATATENGDAVATSKGYKDTGEGWRQLGRVMGAYYDAKVVGEATAYVIGGDYYEYTQQMKNKLRQSFCLAAGIQNCLVSTICAQMLDIEDGHVLAGRGPGGEFIRAGSLNAERSIPLLIAGLSGETLKQIFGSDMINIAGKTVNVSDPKFNPKDYGQLTLTRYHFQLHLRNPGVGDFVEEKTLEFNIHFKGPQREVTWFVEKQRLETGQSVLIDEYVTSTYEYTEICAQFKPDLPSQNKGTLALGEETHFTTNKLCSPFDAYEGGAMTTGGGGEEETPEPETTGGTPPSRPGGNI